MIGLLVCIVAWNFYIGLRRGLFMQAYYVVSVIGPYFYQSLGGCNLWVPYTNPAKDASIAFFKRSEHLTWPCLLCRYLPYFAIYCVANYGCALGFLPFWGERPSQRRYQKVVGGVLASLVSLVQLICWGIFLRLFPMNSFKRSCHPSWVCAFWLSRFSVSQIISTVDKCDIENKSSLIKGEAFVLVLVTYEKDWTQGLSLLIYFTLRLQ